MCIRDRHYVFHEDTETFTVVYTEFSEDYLAFYDRCCADIEKAKQTRSYGLDGSKLNYFDASYIPWLSYEALHVELPDGHLHFPPIINWGKYRSENERLMMPLTAGYRNRYFVLNEVNAIIDIDTQKKLTIDFVTGKFGGTMVGDGVEIKGNINLAQQIPHYDLHLELYNILPASLGIADIKDTVSITASVTGELPNPVIDGHLDFKELNIPGLHFSKVRGDLHYEDALLKFTNVKGNVFGGTVEAFGDYHLDTKYYNIDALGHELLGSIAARNGKIKCKVELDFKIRSKGDPKTALTYGSFKSGKGSYYIIPFDSISGEFSNQNKHLEFKNVVIETKMGTIKTDAFDIVNGKLHIGEIYLEEPENGQTIKII